MEACEQAFVPAPVAPTSGMSSIPTLPPNDSSVVDLEVDPQGGVLEADTDKCRWTGVMVFNRRI